MPGSCARRIGGEVEFDEGARFTPGGRRAGLDAQFRLLRRHVEHIVACGGLLGPYYSSGMAADCPVAPALVWCDVELGLPPLNQYSDVHTHFAADPDRGVGAGDQKRAREAAARHLHADRARPSVDARYELPAPTFCLRELIDTPLEKLLIGPQIAHFVGLCRGRCRDQRRPRRSGRRAPPWSRLSVFWSLLPQPSEVAPNRAKNTRSSRLMILRASRRSSVVCSLRSVSASAWPETQHFLLNH